MGAYVLRRLLWLPFLLFAVTLVTFALGRFGPGDPVVVMLGARYTEERAKPIREALGLDRPFAVQYVDYMWGALRGDFGESLRFRGRPVWDLLAPKIWVSLQVNSAAMAVSLAVGLPVGFWIAHRQGTWVDPVTVSLFLVLMSIPIMVSIPFLMLTFCLKLDLVPCSGWGGFWDLRMIIPAASMGILGVAGLARLMRASTLDVMGQDFIRTAHAKGLSGFQVDSRHILKNAMIPIVTVLSFSLAGIFTTSFIVERIVGFPGVGNLLIDSIFNRDYPVIMAFTLLGSTVFVLANLLADLSYAFIDPRIRFS